MFNTKSSPAQQLQQEANELIREGLVTQAELAIEAGHITQLIEHHS